MEKVQQNSLEKYFKKENDIKSNKTQDIGNIQEIQSVKGLYIVQNFLSEQEEDYLIKEINKQQWNTSLKRRTQHYGYIYDYTSKSIDESNQIGDLPDFCKFVIKRMLQLEILQQEPDQLIINEYEPGQGINAHIDKKEFFQDNIISISLGSQCIMEFSKSVDSKNKENIVKEIILKRKSLVKLSGEARYDWKHGIKARKYDIIKGTKYERKKRISLTFRIINKKKIQTDTLQSQQNQQLQQQQK